MNLIIPIDESTEFRLKELAAMAGTDAQTFALNAIVEKLQLMPTSDESLSHEAWRAKFDALLASVPATTATFVDDSRESIYEGRGE